MASLAEMERELIIERTRAGSDVARQFGRKGGRKPNMTESKIESAKKLLASGLPAKEVAKKLGVPFLSCIAGFQPRHSLSARFFRFLKRPQHAPYC